MNSEYLGLVVDDDADICRCVAERLAAMGHKCDCANCVEDARRMFDAKRYDYVILDMELPVRYGSPPDVGMGVLFLRLLREKRSSDELPVIVITAKMEDRKNIGLPSELFDCEATDLLLKPLVSEGEHTLETSIRKFVEKRKDGWSVPAASAEWLFREPDKKDASIMVWKTVSKTGKERIYPVKMTSIRGRLLDCINKMRFRGPVICDMDLITASGSWTERNFYSKDGGAPRGPLKSHVCELRKKLGMKITYVDKGIKVEQPEK